MYEIERKFLLSKFNLTDYAKPVDVGNLAQGYTEDHIRFTENYSIVTGKATNKINFKQGTGLSRLEAQCEISKDVYDSVWLLTLGHRIFKTRYVFTLQDGLLLEVDIYKHAKMHPLITAEVEFDSILKANTFDSLVLEPYHMVREVTDDIEYSNYKLSC